MENRQKGFGSRLQVRLVVAVVVLVLGAAIYVASPHAQVGTPTVTTDSYPNSISTSATSSTSTGNSSSTLGLELLLSVNSTAIPSEDAINISTEVLNTRPTANNLTASDDWAIQNLSSGSCDLGNSTNKMFSPVGLGVFKGTYALNNISSAGRPLSVWAVVSCPADFISIGNQSYPLRSITSYSLLPRSDKGTYTGYYAVPGTPENLAKGVFTTGMGASGAIYAANGTGFYNSLHSALPSNYTLVAGDEWGQLTLLHFEVTPSNILPKVGNFLSSAPGCSPGPCIGYRLSDALVFNCAAAAATPSGCSEIYSEGVRYSAAPPVNYTVTVWYPSYGQPNEPASANCMYISSPVGAMGEPSSSPSFGYCLMVGPTSFVVSLPFP